MGRLLRSFGSLGFCYTLAATVSMVGAVGASSYLSLLRQREVWLADLRERSASIIHHARGLAAALARADRQAASRELARWVADLPTLSSAAFGLNGKPLCWRPRGLVPPALSPSDLERLAGASEPLASTVSQAGQPVYAVLLPLRRGGELVGAARVVYSLDEVLLREGAAWRHAVGMTAGVALVGVLLAYLLKGLALAPLRRLSAEMKLIATGRLDRKLAEPTDPEVAEAVRAFNAMVTALAAARRELENYNQALEAEVAAARRQLQRAQDELIRNARLATAGQLAAGLAHELNNPLTGILVVTGCLQDRARDGTMEEDLGEVERLARRCQAIVAKLMALATDAPLRRLPLEINLILQRALERAAAPGGLHLRVALDPAGGRLLGDPDLLEEALVAILANAIQATQEGGTVAMTTERRGDCLAVLVKDTGPGMTPEEVERALDPFFTTRGVGEGMGLGLSIAYSIIRRHGGKMTLESARGEGTTVRITLPAEPACDASRA